MKAPEVFRCLRQSRAHDESKLSVLSDWNLSDTVDELEWSWLLL